MGQQRRAGGDRTLRTMAFCFLAVAVVSAGLGLWAAYDRAQFDSRAVPATGTVVGFTEKVDRDDDGRRRTLFRPEIEFDSPNGESITFSPNTASNPPAYDVGEQVNLLVDPDDPQRAVVDSWWQRWFGLVIAGLLTVIFGGFGLLMLRSGIGRRPQTVVVEDAGTLDQPTDWIIPEDGHPDEGT